MKRVAVVIPMYGNRVLIMRRSKTATQDPLRWDFPGGHIDGNETPEQGALRELKEEAALSPPPATLEKVNTIEEEDSQIHLYRVRITDPFNVRLRDGEHDQYCWTTLAHLGCYPLSYGVERALEEMRDV